MDQQQQQDTRFREPIAVIGSACRFPGGASSPSKLWKLLQQPRDVVKEFDPSRLNLSRFYHKSGDTHGATDVGNKSYLLEEDTRLFDAAFFGISPVEAAGMDPQQRILLEAVYEACESAGMTLDELKGSFTSVHVGCMTSDYANIQARDTETVPKYNATGSANSILSNRISYIFDLKGPSETIDTACSSSLVALHNAARGLLNGDCNTAVVAGVNLILDPAPYINESKLHMLSPDARSRMWDKSANGYARGEGAGALLLKTLSQALKDGDYIEGLVRATGVNSDGQSPGITMPFAPTQTALIQQTYARAGLDPIKDRPQYIECHGTGTPAGDPVEARALSDAFIAEHEKSTNNPIFVGSIKTVIGHLEGGAGIAGVIKVLLSIKHRVIPPNLLFKELSPDIAPYYGPLQIPTKAIPWPELPPGTPARASVNSFGFGGTNSHAIIESFDEDSVPQHNSTDEEGTIGPFVFSAKSGASLLRSIKDNLEFLEQDSSIDLRDLSALLQSRRTTHRVRAHFSGSSKSDILDKMAEFVRIHEKSSSDQIGHQPQLINPKEVPGILGVFTGQGAQWPAMGRELIKKSSLFRKCIQECEAVLSALPEQDIPKWSLMEELLKDDTSSRISEAAISQPLCSAVQLALVRLLEVAGVKFDAVVGHSSGEIAATFAAGIINLQGAMQIAYYRGLHAKSARGINGVKGAMMAAGLSFMDAKAFCSRPEFNGQIKVAASNAPKSVTLSGDVDAITKAYEILQAENIFARRLQVDTAYHSHHMVPCSQPYLDSLLACNIKVMQPAADKCTWISSVRGDTQLLRGDLSSLKGQYWVDNMVRTVLFTQAVESSIWHGGPFDLVIEVGPHPALKGPTEQTLKASYGAIPVYTGVLKRGGNDVEAFSSAIATTWAQLGPGFIRFAGYRSLFYETDAPLLKIPKGLPSYSWDHDKVYWREGRLSRRFRLGKDKSHELLGRRTLDDNDTELRWRNVLKLTEMAWLRGHEVLGEVLLPGASYISIAVEAAKSLAMTVDKGIRLIEVENVNILRPVVVPEGADGVETLFTTHVVKATKDYIQAKFIYYVCPDETLGSMLQTCNGDISVYFETHPGSLSEEVLPPRDATPTNLTSIDTERVYSLFKDIGLNYSGLFRGISTIDRQLDYASTTSTWAEGLNTSYVVHPAMLDVAFQTMFIAKAHPASRQISSALLPSHIDRVRINPAVHFTQSNGGAETTAEFETWAVKQTANSLIGDLNIYDAATGKTFLQVEGLSVNSVGEQDASSDRSMFSRTIWGQDVSLGLPDPVRDPVKDAEGLQMAHAVERVALFYVKSILNEVKKEERKGLQWHHQRMFEAFEEHIRVVKVGEHPIILAEWLDDEASILDELDASHGDTIDFKLLHAVGKDLADVVRGNKQMLEVMTKDDMLNRFYMEGYASVPTNKAVGDALRQLSFKYPRAKILEIGAGTGGTSWSVLNSIGDAYDSYTYTDVSSGFFHLAEEKFSKFAHKMIFKVLDIEQEPKDQGFAEHSYDIIVAALVLHATHDLEKTMRHARSLLKPGGFLVMVELTGTMSVRATLVMGGLPGWWLGEGDGRRLSPLVTAIEWDRLLQDTGFSGADAVIHDLANEDKHCTALIMGQAIDDDFQRLRSPLSTAVELPIPTEPIVVIGGKRLSTSKIVREIQKLLPKKWDRQMRLFKSIDEIDMAKLTPGMDVLCLQDVDEPPFAQTMTDKRMTIIQSLLMNAKNLLWVTCAGESQTPRANLIHGIMRVVPSELPQLNVQVLGLETGEIPANVAKKAVEMFLRLRETGTDGGNSHRDMLWSMEPELDIIGDQIMIPRVIPDIELNELYNASKRVITKTVDAKKIPVNVVQRDGKLSLQIATVHNTQYTTGSVPIQVHYSVRIPGTSGDELFIISGQSADSSWVAAMTSVNASIVYVDGRHLIPIDERDCTPEKLVAMSNFILAWAIMALAAPNASVLLFEADDSLAVSVKAKIAAAGGKVILAAAQTKNSSTDFIKVHTLASRRATQRLVPRDVKLYIDCSSGSSPASATLLESMPNKCLCRKLSTDLIQEALRTAQQEPVALLGESYVSSHVQVSTVLNLIPAEKLAGSRTTSLNTTTYVTDWKQKSLPTTIQPLNVEGIFRADKTYFMAGMAGGLGLSICQWMIRNGAKHMVITSRRPEVDRATLEEAERVGASVKVLAMDLTKRESVEKVVQEVRDTMPPIAGVCNAAMVLKDGFFVDMDVDQFNNTLAAKVIGSENLDSIFGSDPLDFFILLGSVASVIGNVGQSNYHAANLFMTSLVHQRRARGLAASIIHIAYVTDVGYVTREERDRQLDSHFRKVRLMPTSETDVHHAFAKAVKGGKPGSTSGYYDIIMGIEPLTEAIPSDQQPLWMKNPRFAHFDQHAIHAQHERGSGATTENVRALVDKAEKEEDAIDAVMAAFCGKLESILQLTVGSINVQRPITDLGIDSLVAVEIRTWFLKELGADVPVVKILGGDTVQQLSTIATKKLLAKNMEAGAEKKSTTEMPTDTPAPVSAPAPASIPSPRIAVESSNIVFGDRIQTDQTGPTLTPESGRSPFLTAQNVLDFDSVSVLTAASKQEDSISSSSSYTKGEAPEVDNKSERSNSIGEGKLEDMRVRPEILREERMSPAQARLWFLSQHLENASAYNMAFRYRVQGPIGIARLKHALSVTTYNHECLRMCFYSRLEDGHPMQGVMASSLHSFKHFVDASDADVDKEMSRLSTRKWDLEHGHTMEVTLLSRSPEDHVIIIAYHHIIMDVMGLGIVLNDLNNAYNMKPLDKSAGSYVDFSAQQLERQTRGEFDQQLAFWEAEFKTIPDTMPPIPFANISNHGIELGTDAHHQYRELSDAQFLSLKAACQHLRISPFHFHLSLLQILLSRYTNSEDMCIGIVDANRNDHRFASTVGCFVNMVPVRLHVPGRQTGFAAIAQKTRKSALQALENSAVPFDMILDKIKIPRSSGSTPLFQVALNYRTGSIWEMPLGRAKLNMEAVKDANNPYDLSLGVAETRTGCMVEVYASSSLYSAEACCTIMDAYMRLLDDFSGTPDLEIGKCKVYGETDIERSLEIGTGPIMNFGWPATLSERFLDMVRLYSTNQAVTDKTCTLSYAQLLERVNAVSDALNRHGCKSDSRIAVLCEPSVDTIVSMLAILHIGAVYVPLDVSLPTSRHAAMVQSCKPPVILSHSATGGIAKDLMDKVEFPIQQIIIDDIVVEEVRITVPCAAKPDTCSVILFTSGSTGTPKGIMLSQANFVNHLALKTRLLGLGKETVLQQSSTGFDMSMIQMFCALANGGRLVIAPFEIRRDPIEMVSLVRSEQISLSIATPSEYLAWTNYGAANLKGNVAWRHICMGGEPVTRQLVAELNRLGLPNLTVTNCYGPTEITAAASFQTIDLEGQENANPDMIKYTVGKVLPNYTVSILDSLGSPQPVNYTGEICIGGAGVALGYVNPSEEADSKFIVTEGGQKMYRTGDRGRLLPNGTLLLFGRIDGDSQIKLRGLRIDLQEIELAVVEAADGLLSTVVVSQRGDVLIAHATISAEKNTITSVTDDDLTAVLRKLTLPQYFIPARIVILPTLPTNANGKLDRKAIGALPLPQSQFIANPALEEEKMTVGEGELRLLWERVLPQATSSKRISPSSDFFLLGGNSLLLMKLQAAIKDSMNVIMSTRKLYQASTLRDMARSIGEQRQSQIANDAELEIDWVAETAIPKWLLNQIHERSQTKISSSPKPSNEEIAVLMTGATTFLGGHLLKSLLQSDKVSKVYCIAIPADDQHLLPEDSKIECFTGSLLSPTLGLSTVERQRLELTADIIVHAGGSGHCLNTYATLRTPNVLSTQFLSSMALPRSIPLLFLSSNRVVLLTGNTAPPAASVSAFLPATDGREGHMMSKWASEVFLENLVGQLHASSPEHQQNPWTVSVHRPSVIVSENAPNSDALNAILRYSILMRTVPRMDNVEGYLDLAQLEAVVAELLESVIHLGSGHNTNDSTEIVYKHHSGGVKVPTGELWSHLEQVHGVTFEEVDMKEWLRRAAQAGIDPLITAYLEAIQSNGATMIFPYMGSD